MKSFVRRPIEVGCGIDRITHLAGLSSRFPWHETCRNRLSSVQVRVAVVLDLVQAAVTGWRFVERQVSCGLIHLGGRDVVATGLRLEVARRLFGDNVRERQVAC